MNDRGTPSFADEEAAARLREKTNVLKSSLRRTGFSLPDHEIAAVFDFNLIPRIPPEGGSDQRVDGLCALTNDSLYIYENGSLCERIDLSDAADFRIVSGIGCVSAECTVGGADRVILRADASHFSELSSVMKQINVFKETGVFTPDPEAVPRACEKCGRPFPAGSTTCPHCIDKKKVVSRLWEIASPYKAAIFASVVLFFAITGVNLITPVLNRILVDDFIKIPDPADAKLGAFTAVIISMAAVKIVSNVLSVLRTRALIYSGNKIIVKLRETVFAKIQMMSFARISRRTAGELMTRVNNDTSEIQNFLINIFPEIFEETLTLLAVSILLFIYDWRLALLILCPAPFVSMSFRIFWKSMRRIRNRQWHTYSKSNTVLHDIFSGIRVVKAFGTEESEAERFRTVSASYRDISMKGELIWALIFPWLNFFMGIGEFFLLFYVGNRIIGGTMTLGEMAQFSSYVSMIYGPLRWITNIPRKLMAFTTSTAKVFEIIDEKIDVADRDDPVKMRINGTVDFKDVSFGYDKSADVLKNITLHAEPGEMIGIVGRSGVGKSTLINLLMRIYDVDGGEILIDGVDIRDISQDCLRSQIGVVLQETFLFAGPIYDNIAYAKPDATRDEVITAAKISGAHEFIMKLPDAYNTAVGEKGATLSGGERQRIAIARALLHDPRILILDEATSSLDTETEKNIQDSLAKLIKDRTTFAIAHRLSTLRNATRLIVLDRGKVAEVGTHEELLKKKGIYYGLVMSQRQMSKMSPN